MLETKDRRRQNESVTKHKLTKDEYMLTHFEANKAYLSRSKDLRMNADVLLETMKTDYSKYRKNWNELPRKAIENKAGKNYVEEIGTFPLSLDIETAAICDLACPFCYRQTIATPDTLIKPELAYKIIDQAAELNVSAIKFNWRGEPLMHPKLPEFIAYAKKKGIVETLINTNATKLTKEKAEELIDAGLDVIIYSFDGGTKETYDKLRPGRFEKNEFENVLENIKTLTRLKKEKKSFFPYTRIQMVLTEDTFREKDQFIDLFSEHIDDVSTIVYTERGGDMSVLSEKEQREMKKVVRRDSERNDNVAFLKDLKGNLFVENGRIPCEQIFQRMLVSYDGRVFMCCFDWGNEHPIGYLSDDSFKNGDQAYEQVLKSSKENKNGYEMLNLQMPSREFQIKKEVKALKDIWNGKEIQNVREKHVLGEINSIAVCEKCASKETYHWEPVLT